MRKFTKEEELKIKLLIRYSMEMVYLEPTLNGLKKSIMDATLPVRHYFESKKVHDYRTQKQGQDNKKTIKTFIFTKDTILETKTSLYRPITKKGDPRIWIYGLTNFAHPNDIISLIIHNNELCVLNLTKVNILTVLRNKKGPLYELIKEINKTKLIVSKELLGKLKKIAAEGPIESISKSDTGVGRTLEKLLNISMNSSKDPDYKGIELKSFRSQRNNRKTLFAQVPDWSISDFKSSKEILNAFGYNRNGTDKLYCTVNALKRNSQGLLLRIDEEAYRLHENSAEKTISDFVAWKIEKLHQRLLEKHNETFWIEAKSIKKNNKEFFDYRKVEHTKNPAVLQFVPLIEQGYITLDHLIKRKTNGGVQEKGPLFKLKSSAMSLLFPKSNIYNLKTLKTTNNS